MVDAVAADASGDDEVRDRADRAKPPPRRLEITHDVHDDVVEVECAGQTGRIIGKGGSKIREIEELTGCVLRVRQEEGVCEVSGRDVNAAVQEIKNIVQEGRERDEGGQNRRFRKRLRRPVPETSEARRRVLKTLKTQSAPVRRASPRQRVAARLGRQRLDVRVRFRELREAKRVLQVPRASCASEPRRRFKP